MSSNLDRFSVLDTVVSSDKAMIYSNTNGDWRVAPYSVVLAYLQSNLTSTDDKISQYSAPSATGFSVQITDGGTSVWLILTPTAGFAAGTIVLPQLANALDKQEVLVNCTQVVTTLTVSGNGATVTGAPTTLAANAYFRLRFDGVTDTWYRVG